MIGSINRLQQAYFLKHEDFNEEIPQLGVGIRFQEKYYEYSIRAIPLAVFSYATSRNQEGKGYVGAVFLTTGTAGEISTVAIQCEAKSPGITRPAPPIVRGNIVECGSNTKQLGGFAPIVIGKDSALAYSVLNDATAGRYDQALEKAQAINNNVFRARALAAIAGELAAADQKSQAVSLLSQALEVAESIKDDLSKALALQAIAIELIQKGQYDQALKVAHSIQDGNHKEQTLQAIAIELAEKGRYDQALEITKTIKDDSGKQTALSEIAPHLTTATQYDQALNIAQSIEYGYDKARALEAIAPHLTTATQYDKALEIAKTIKDDSDKQRALDAITRYKKSRLGK